MIQSIDLFLPPRSLYQVLNAFTYSLAEAFLRAGVRVRVLEAKKERPDAFINQLLSDQPECTLSFNGLLPDEEGHFFSDLINIPHVACLVDGPQHFIPLTKSQNTIITCVDRFACDFFEGMNHTNTLFMPHAVDKNAFIDPEGSLKKYDALMLSSYIDYEAIAKKWRHTPILGEIWEEAASLLLADNTCSSAQAIAKAMDNNIEKISKINPQTIDFIEALNQIEDYVNGKQRVDLVKAITDVNVTVCGAGHEHWKAALKGQKNVTVHSPVAFTEALLLMRQSKVVLNSRPSIKNGAHERIFSAIASGAAVLTNDNMYIHENFQEGEEILLFKNEQWGLVNDIVCDYVHNDHKRLKMIEKGQIVVRDNHTWDHRAATILSELEPILKDLLKTP